MSKKRANRKRERLLSRAWKVISIEMEAVSEQSIFLFYNLIFPGTFYDS